MARKLSALLTLAAFVAFPTSCVTWGRKDVTKLTRPLPENTPVLSVVKTSGEVVQFSKAEPGRVNGFTVVGKSRVTKQREIAGPFPSVKKSKEGRIYEVTDAEGHVYSVQTLLSQSDTRMSIMSSESVQVSIPLSEVREVEIKKTGTLLTASAIISGIALGLAICVAIVVSNWR